MEIFAATFGLIIGSFLNVVIVRLPNQLNLALPRSFCTKCQNPLRVRDNIPILSFLLLKGKCFHCQQPISRRYPLIELLSTLATLLTAYRFGFGWTAMAACTLTWSLIALSAIDIEHYILPDEITLLFIWLGLAVNINHTFTDLQSSVLGTMGGYLSLWCIHHAFYLCTRKEGMGYGDFKLLAMLGAWLGWQALPVIILLSSISGLLVAFPLILFKRLKFSQAIPFGPFLAFAGWIYLIFGESLRLW